MPSDHRIIITFPVSYNLFSHKINSGINYQHFPKRTHFPLLNISIMYKLDFTDHICLMHNIIWYRFLKHQSSLKSHMILLSLLVTLFLEFWKRRQAELEYEWDTVELQQEEQPRPEYEAQCTHVVINEITQVRRMLFRCILVCLLQGFSTLAAHWGHLGTLENTDAQVPSPHTLMVLSGLGVFGAQGFFLELLW